MRCATILSVRFENIKLNAINIKDERFRISHYFDLTPLIRSISEIGLIHPPVVTYRKRDALIVTGWKRVLACQTLALSSIPCRIYEGQDDREAFRLAFEENLTFRPFTLLEKARILIRLVQFGVSENDIIKHDLPLLEIPQTIHYLDKYLLIAALDPETKSIIHSKNMGFPVAQLLTKYGEEERRLLIPFLHALGQNKQRELLQNLLEISKRDHIPIQSILAGQEIQRTAMAHNLSPLQKAEEIRKQIHKKRYPALSSWVDSFKSRKRGLDWPDDIKIEPSPFFEKEEFEAQFTFKDFDEYRTKLTQLNELASEGKVSQLLEFFSKKEDE